MKHEPDCVCVTCLLAKPATTPPLPPPEPIMQFFEWAHLPEKLQAVSRPFGELAASLVATLPRNAERTVALRKLLESKDAAARASIARPQ